MFALQRGSRRRQISLSPLFRQLLPKLFPYKLPLSFLAPGRPCPGSGQGSNCKAQFRSVPTTPCSQQTGHTNETPAPALCPPHLGPLEHRVPDPWGQGHPAGTPAQVHSPVRPGEQRLSVPSRAGTGPYTLSFQGSAGSRAQPLAPSVKIRVRNSGAHRPQAPKGSGPMCSGF